MSLLILLISFFAGFSNLEAGKPYFFMKGGNQTLPAAHKTGFTFDLNNTKFPPQVKELVPFEEHLMKLVKNLRFQKVDNKFQRMQAKI